MAKEYDKEAVISDWKTGGYTIRELAHKHKISRGTIGPIVKGVDKELSDKVDAKVVAEQDIRRLSDKDGQAVRELAERITSKQIKAEKTDDYLDGALGLAAQKAVEIINQEDITMNEIVGFGKFQLDARKGLGTLKEQASTVINNTNAQQNNTPKDFNDFYDE